MPLSINPRDARDEHEILASLRGLTAEPGYIHALAFLAWRDNYIGIGSEMTPADMAKSYVDTRLLRSELITVQGMMIQSDVKDKLPDPDKFGFFVDETIKLMAELHAAFNKPMMQAFDLITTSGGGSLFNQSQFLREPIFYGGESAHAFQYSAFSSKRYASDNDWLMAHVGFGAQDMQDFVYSLNSLQEEKILSHSTVMLHQRPDEWTFLPAFVFSPEELSEKSGMAIEVIANLIDSFSVKPGENTDFVEIGDFNIVLARSIIKLGDGKYACLDVYTLSEAVYDSPFYWMQSDQDYRVVAARNRGSFTEEFTRNRLDSVFGKENVFQNVNIEGKKGKRAGEIDIFVRFGDRALVIQCKSKKLTLEARKGNDGQLKSDFKKSVQNSYDQAASCVASMISGKYKVVAEDGAEIDISQISEFYPICVTSENYPALTVQARENLVIRNGVKGLHPPFVTDVFMIDVITEFLNSPLYIISYIDRRVNFAEIINSINEFSIFGYHLKHNLWFEDDTDLVMFDDSLAIDLDTAFSVRRRNLAGSQTPEGILTKIQTSYVGRLLKAIEHSPNPGLIALGLSLLKLSGDTIDTIEAGVASLCSTHLRDQLHHDFSLAFGSGSEGLTIHCNDLPQFVSLKKLEDHCARRKYVTKARSWFGISINASDGMPKFGITLQGPWKQDEAMETDTAKMNKVGNLVRVGRMLKPLKPGRNSLCPCGSGKKYKKCCLRG